MSNNAATNTVTLVERKILLESYRTVEDVTVQYISPITNALSAPMSREIVRYQAVAAVLLYHPETDSILLSREFRVGPYIRGGCDPWLWEVSGGMIDDGENPHETAVREAFEETGSRVIALEKIGEYFPSAGSSDEIFHMFCGRLESVKDGGHYGLLEEGEEITTRAVKTDEAIAMLDRGEILHMGTALCLNWFVRNKQRIRAMWS